MTAVVFDHVALAAEHQRDVLPRYVGELGATFSGYGEGPGFSPLQVRFANGAKVELLRPTMVERNDFLRRFLDQRGPGAHHFTFKVPDIVSSVAALGAAGYPVVNVDLTYPDWKEAFVHPKAAGIVVQLAETPADSMPGVPPRWFDAAAPEVEGTAALVRAEHAVASLASALTLFRDLLEGQVEAEHDAVEGGGRAVDLVWKGPSRLRLYEPGDDGALGGEPGRFGRLVFTSSRVTEADRIAADANQGTEILVLPG